MKLNSFLTSLESRNRLRNFLFQNTRYNPIPITTSLPFKTTPSLLSSTNDAKLNIDYIKQKYGYYNYTSVKSAFDKINQIKTKYFKEHSNNNYKVNNTESITIENNNKYDNKTNLLNENNKNNWDKNLKFDKQSSFNYKTLSPIKLNLDNPINNEKKYYETDKLTQISIIQNEDFDDNKINDSNILNKDDSKNINLNLDESWNEKKYNDFKKLYPISTRLKILKKLKTKIDKYTKDDSIQSNRNTSLNSSNNSYTYLDFIKIKPHVSKKSIYDQVFTSRENSTSNNSNIRTPNLIKTNSKPKPNVPSYHNFMKNHDI